MKKNIRVSLSFATFANGQLNSFVILVLICMKNSVALFPTPPITLIALQAMLTAFQNAQAQADIGGPIDTALMYEAHDTLVGALRQIAGYIQSLGLTLESDVLSSGYDIIVPGKNTPVPLLMPVISLDNSVTTQLGVLIPALAGAKAYQVQYMTGTGAWMDLGIFPNTRNIIIPGLTPGTTYSARARGVGGSTQYSPWSVVVPIMCT